MTRQQALSDLPRIEALARASLRPTSAVNGSRGWPGAGDLEQALLWLLAWPEPVADYIAAMSPETCLALLDRLRELESLADRLRRELDDKAVAGPMRELRCVQPVNGQRVRIRTSGHHPAEYVGLAVYWRGRPDIYAFWVWGCWEPWPSLNGATANRLLVARPCDLWQVETAT